VQAVTVRAPVEAAPAQSLIASRSFADELWQLLRLGVPIALVQFGMTALNFVDVAMLGHHDQQSLPAMALGNTLSWAALVFCFGATTAVDPLLSQAVGARDAAALPRVLGRGMLLAAVLSIPAALCLLPAATWLTLLQQPEALVADAAAYARIQSLGILPFLLYAVLRSLLSAHARVWPQVLTILVGNALNVLLDWTLIYGRLGMPALGATGASIATVLCRWWMFGALLWFGRKDLMPHLRQLRDATVRRSAFALGPLWRLLKLGAPIGLQFALEMGVFATTALLIGGLDARGGVAGREGPGLGGHQIALQLASLSFMVPLGLGMAASVRVGWAVGRGDASALRRSAGAALVAGAGVMTCFMLLFLLLPGVLAGSLTTHPEVLAMASTLIPIAGVFQIGDGLQVVAIGCLRGLGDVRSPVIANVVGFWVVGLPLGCWFAFGLEWGPAGLWWGLVLGLFVVAAGLLVVLRWRLLERRERLAVE
jgi:multidrug resistance protein, MATE family